MAKDLGWKIALIVAVMAAATYFMVPPSERINLGLDLRGGSHIVMKVETESALKYDMDLTQSRIGQALKEKALTYASVASSEPTVLEVKGTDPNRRADVRRVLDDYVGQWDIKDQGGGNWRAVMPTEVRQAIERNSVETTLTTLRNRIDGLGVREPIIQKQGVHGDRILIQLPGLEDPTRAKDVLQDPALLEWKAVTYPPGVTDFENWSPPDSRDAVIALFQGQIPADTELYPERRPTDGGGTREIWWPLKKVSTVVGSDLTRAQREQGSMNEWVVGFALTRDAGRRFEAATRENLKKKMAIILGGVRSKQVVSAPVIQDVIRDRGIIRGGNFTLESTEDLALKLRSGAIPTEVTIIEERTVGPSLGLDSIRAGIVASLVGFLAVMVFVLIYYRLSGINAMIALAFNVVLLLGSMGYFGATLTLPGIAGLILTVGMAVDSNVLIFERIREELRLGKTVRSAVDQGFGRAIGTILDCNITTLVSAFFLFSYGTGPVRGFAVTLIIGLTASMFTAVFVSRVIFDMVLGQGRKVESLSI